MPPAARITDLHVCPAESPEPHVGGPIVTGSADVLINGLPASTVGSIATCDGPPSAVVQGCATIFINGKPAAHLGHLTSHGGFISTGSPNVIYGDQPFVPPPANPLAGMSCLAKMKEALAHAPWDEGLIHALGGAKGVAALVVGIVVLQMVPIAGEVEDALLVIGSVVAGGNVLKGLAQLKQFHDACCNDAKTEADLIAAGKLAADAVATIGVNALLGMLPFVAKSARGTKIFDEAASSRSGLDQLTIDSVKATPKGTRPSPSTYMSAQAIRAHLDQFAGGAAKIAPQAPTGSVGPPSGTFVIPKTFADRLIANSNGSVASLEQQLSLEPGTLGSNPVLIDVPQPSGLRMSDGNELGANSQWSPGGFTEGGMPEATIDQIKPGTYTTTPIFPH